MGKNKYQKNKFLGVTVGDYSVMKTGKINVPFSFHDANIINENADIKEEKGELFVLKLDSEGSFCAFDSVVFHDYVIKQNRPINDAWCMYAEFYLLDNGRYKAIFNTDHNIDNQEEHESIDFIIDAKSIEFKSDDYGTKFPPNH